MKYALQRLACAVAVFSTLFAQDSGIKVSISPRVRKPAEDQSKPLGAMRIAVNLVLVPVLVTDTYDRPVRGLNKDAFRLYEDGVEQKVTQFFSAERPNSIGILFDASTSMQKKMEESRQAVSRFLNLSMPGDEFFLYKFSNQPDQMCGFTTETKVIEEALPTIQAKGWTALYDAIYLGMNHMKRASRERKALLVVSDGADNRSRYHEREIKRLVQEGDVRIFAISIQDKSPELEKLAEESGGRAFRVKKLDDLSDVVLKISQDLHSEYVLGYSPANQVSDGKFRKLKVQTLPGTNGTLMRASWRRGYYGPAE